MTNRLLHLHTLAALATLTASLGLQAQEANLSFQDGCSRASPEDMRPRVIEKLDELEAALAKGDVQKAQTAKSEAEGATYDVAGWTGALALKCLHDQPVYRRYFVNSQELWQLQADKNSDDVASGIRAALWKSVEDGSPAKNILADIPDDYRSYGIARDWLNQAAEFVASHRELGAFVLDEETALERQAQQAIDLIGAHATQRSGNALDDEKKAFYRDATEFEKEGAQTLEDLTQFASAMGGVEMNGAEQAEYQLARQRIRGSREQLDQARGWEIAANLPADSSPAYQLAAERGDEVLSWAEDDELSYTIRDEYYERAVAYFNWCECRDKSAQAFAAKEAIQPELQAEQARRQAQADEARAQLESKAEEMQRAIDDMQKTDAEKKAFDDEADALEAELGF